MMKAAGFLVYSASAAIGLMIVTPDEKLLSWPWVGALTVIIFGTWVGDIMIRRQRRT